MRTSARLLAWVSGALLVGSSAAAQIRIDGLTEVRSIRFKGVHELPKRRLESTIRTRTRGSFYGFRALVGKLPLVPSPAVRPFSPLTLQEDVVRLRGLYAASGFFKTFVRYDVDRDDDKNLLDVTFVIEEGAPIIVADVTIGPRDSLSALPIPDDGQGAWKRLVRSVRKQQGRRLIVDDARQARDQLEQWWRNRGYPRAVTAVGFSADTAHSEARLAYRVEPGSFARFGEVEVEGTKTISPGSIRRQIPIEPGEPYSAAALKQSEMDLQELDIVRVAHVDVPTLEPDSAAAARMPNVTVAGTPPEPAGAGGDSLLPARIRITESDRRQVRGDLGYVTDGGLSAEARWSHRNFSGGGRSLTITSLAQTGWLALTENPDERYRLSASLKQPGLFVRHVSGVVSPFIEYRDDTQDRSTQYGLNTTLIGRLAPLRSMSLDYKIARRDVKEYRLEDLATGDIDLFSFLVQASQGVLDSLGTSLFTSAFTLSGTAGTLDNAANPRRGVIVRPALQVTAPTSISSTAYWRLDVTANGFAPFGHSVILATRVKFGRLYPFGKSLPGVGDDPQTKFLQLRDASFTAGGTGDVRGWENRLLGPKVPDVRFETVGDSLVPHADGYVPYGGFQSTTFSTELRMPLPGFGPNFGTIVFLDGGRVWTNDARYGLEGDPHGQEKLFVATGAGLTLTTPVGPIQISTGYKLNPSVLDLVDSEDVVRAGQEGRPIEDLPRKNSRRWQVHLAIGASY